MNEQQRDEALKRANEVRLARAQVKRDLLAGTVSVFDLIEDPPACIEKVPVQTFLLWLPRFGKQRVNRVLMTHPWPVNPVTPLMNLGAHSRRQIARRLGDTEAFREEYQERISARWQAAA